MAISHIKPMEFAYDLSVQCQDISRVQNGNTIRVNDRKLSRTFENTVWRRNISFEFIDDEVRALIENSGEDASHPHVAQTIALFEDVNTRMQSCSDTASFNIVMEDAYSDLCDIWGAHAIVPKDETIEKFAAEFDGFLRVCDELDSEQPPIQMNTEVSYALHVKKARRINLGAAKRFGLMAGRNPSFSNRVPLWQLPATFYQLQKTLGIAPDVDTAGMYRLYIECIAKEKEDCFRVAVNGHDRQKMFEALAATLEEKELKQRPKAEYRVILTHYAAKNPFYLSAPVAVPDIDTECAFDMRPFQSALQSVIKSKGSSYLRAMP